MVRAKFSCISNEQVYDGQFECTFNAVSDDQEWSKWTPSGELRLATVNASAAAQFVVGMDYWIDIHPVITASEEGGR